MFRWLGRRSKTAAGIPQSASLEYLGFGGSSSLYEFEATSGEHIYLHEFTCTEISYRPDELLLALTFEYPGNDKDSYRSLDLGYRELVVVMTFEDAWVLTWEDGREQSEPLPADVSSTVHGQVTDLAETNGVVVLALLNVELRFTASKVSYQLQ